MLSDEAAALVQAGLNEYHTAKSAISGDRSGAADRHGASDDTASLQCRSDTANRHGAADGAAPMQYRSAATDRHDAADRAASIKIDFVPSAQSPLTVSRVGARHSVEPHAGGYERA